MTSAEASSTLEVVSLQTLGQCLLHSLFPASQPSTYAHTKNLHTKNFATTTLSYKISQNAAVRDRSIASPWINMYFSAFLHMNSFISVQIAVAQSLLRPLCLRNPSQIARISTDSLSRKNSSVSINRQYIHTASSRASCSSRKKQRFAFNKSSISPQCIVTRFMN